MDLGPGIALPRQELYLLSFHLLLSFVRLLHTVLHVEESLFEVRELFSESIIGIICLFLSLLRIQLPRLVLPLKFLDKSVVFSDSHLKAE